MNITVSFRMRKWWWPWGWRKEVSVALTSQEWEDMRVLHPELYQTIITQIKEGEQWEYVECAGEQTSK